jgi:hypothetical protein
MLVSEVSAVEEETICDVQVIVSPSDVQVIVTK